MDPVEIARRLVALLRSGALDSRLWEPPSEDPLSPVREPKPVTPGGRLASVAVDEPDPEPMLQAVGGVRR
jgi:hypothetical protein